MNAGQSARTTQHHIRKEEAGRRSTRARLEDDCRTWHLGREELQEKELEHHGTLAASATIRSSGKAQTLAHIASSPTTSKMRSPQHSPLPFASASSLRGRRIRKHTCIANERGAERARHAASKVTKTRRAGGVQELGSKFVSGHGPWVAKRRHCKAGGVRISNK